MGAAPLWGRACAARGKGVEAELKGAKVLISISTRHGHLSDGSQDKIKAKAEKLSRLFERLTSIEVTVDLEREENPLVEIRVSAEHKHDFIATDQTDGLMASLDGAIHKVEQQLRKYKEKIQDHHRAVNPRQATAAIEPEQAGEA